jgi:hypothetical protein
MTDGGGAASTSGVAPADVPGLPPIRDARVNARLVRVMFYLPGFLALLLIRGTRPEGFGVTVELLMLSSVSAIVAGLLIGSSSSAKAGDAASKSATWAGQIVLDLLAFVPLLMAVPPLFHTLVDVANPNGLNTASSNYYGASELIPAFAMIPWTVYELAGYATLWYLVEKSLHVAFVVFVFLGVVGGYIANRNGWYPAELSIDGAVVLALAIMTVVAILEVKDRQERVMALTPPVPPEV